MKRSQVRRSWRNPLKQSLQKVLKGLLKESLKESLKENSLRHSSVAAIKFDGLRQELSRVPAADFKVVPAVYVTGPYIL